MAVHAPRPRDISTHAPRTGSDRHNMTRLPLFVDFNPRSPHGERQVLSSDVATKHGLFQPTLPARGATEAVAERDVRHPISTHAPRTGSDCNAPSPQVYAGGISTHAPRTGSDQTMGNALNGSNISTHAPRTGSDERWRRRLLRRKQFQPTLPARGATMEQKPIASAEVYFNPRSPHGERPAGAGHTSAPRIYFNPRSPHGERRWLFQMVLPSRSFQPTLPARGATFFPGAKPFLI